jgi:demethylmenaquinone methyltransferase/2-methoxy-6-polyprenyl-1,4-benzoquinol methylase
VKTPPPRRRTTDAGEVHPAAAAEGRERSRRVRDLFAGIAGRYDLVNHVASGGVDLAWRRACVRELGLSPGDWVLDACCGTADLSAALAAAGARVLGVDFCRPMLLQGRDKSAPDAVSLVEGDALRLPAATDSMAAATVAFGIRNVVDPEAGVAEMARCVRPGGRVAVLEFSQPRVPLMAMAYRFYSNRVLPLIGDLLSGRTGTYRYLPQTIQSWHGPEDFAALMQRAGLVDVHWRALTFGVAALHLGTVPPTACREFENPC